MFTALYRHVRGAGTFSYHGLTHKAAGMFDDAEFGPGENAIVDFKYSPDPRVTWWFDHHLSAFLRPEDAAEFQAYRGGQKFYDPGYGSCTKFLADIGRRHFGFDPSPLGELIHWADVVDTAKFPSAQAAVELKEPALQLTLAIEGSNNPTLLQRLIPDYLEASLEELLKRDYLQQELRPLLERHWQSMELIHSRLDCRDGVIAFDLSDLDQEGYNKFVPYYFCPEGVYSVGVSRSQFRMKISVGSSPWTTARTLVNLAELCERHGGGGHARVGAISLPRDEVEKAKAIAREVTEYLRSSWRERQAASPAGR
ncbi:MAG: phosphoesterase [Terriglobales bacterium]